MNKIVPPTDPAAEALRLAAVQRYDILDTPVDGSFDRITAVAAKLFDVPIAIISLVDEDRIWFKSHHGLDVEQIDREPGLCASAIMSADPWILTDAKTDVRSLANPLVAGDFGLRFYVGVPLRTSDGHNLGTLCVIDREPRSVTEAQIEQLSDLASVVMDQMELRLSARRAVADLTKALAQKDVALQRSGLMAKEIDHRVMNSLQLVAGLLSLQGRGVDDSRISEQLDFAANRVNAIARVHRHIYLSEGLESVESREYLQRLCQDLGDILKSKIHVEAMEADILTAQVIPLGLMVNELVTNAAKHGAGEIEVSFGRAGAGSYRLQVSDQGSGLPQGFDPAKTTSLGMKVITSLVKQLGGKLDFGDAPPAGARFTVQFPVKGAQPA